MVAIFQTLSACFTAGVIGGLANGIFQWGAGVFGLSALMGVAIAPSWSPPWLYQKLVWGGVWGMLFIFPLLKRSVLLRGLFFGMAPSAMGLLVVFPDMLGKGMFGLDLGMMTPLFVVIGNTVWGVTAAWWVSLNQEPVRRRRRL
jgi:hypothetical protein